MCTGDRLSVTDALALLDRALDGLNDTDVALLPASVQAQLLRGLERAESKHTAARAAALSAFAAREGYAGDGQGSARSWLQWQARVTRGAAAGAVGWARRLAAHPVVAAALAAGELSASWAKDVCGWSDRLPAGSGGDADEILVGAARAGAGHADLAGLAQEMFERTRGPDTGPSGFGERGVWLGITLGGAGHLRGDLAPGCSAALTAVLDALGKRAGAEDLRTTAQRNHDALAEACQRLLAAGLLPESGGQPARAQLHLSLSQLRNLPGAPGTEAAWATAHTTRPCEPAAGGTATGHTTSSDHHGDGDGDSHGGGGGGDSGGGDGDSGAAQAAARTGEAGWLTGPEADAAACDATVHPVVTGTVDPTSLAKLTTMVLARHGRDRPCRCTCGNCHCRSHTPLSEAARARLRRTLLHLCADVLSGPSGLAAWLRTTHLPPGTGSSPSLPLYLPIPLDTGKPDPVIPAHLRRAVLARHRTCAFPGCDHPARTCHIHHLTPRSRGGPTALSNLVPACAFHHLTAIHTWGWTLRLHPDGTTTATSPDHKRQLHSHSSPQQAA